MEEEEIENKEKEKEVKVEVKDIVENKDIDEESEGVKDEMEEEG